MDLIPRQQESDLWRTRAPDDAVLAWIPDLLGFIRRRWRGIAVSTVVAIGLGLAYLAFATPKFTATTTLLVDTQAANLFRASQPTAMDSSYVNGLLESQVEILSSDAIARVVAAQMHLDQNPAFLANGRTLSGTITGLFESLLPAAATPPRKHQDDDGVTVAAQVLVGMTTVKRVAVSYIVMISVKSNDRDMSAALANALADAYISDGLKAKYDTALRAGGWLQQRSQELHDQAVKADQSVQEFKARTNIVDTDKGLVSERQIGDLNTSIVLARAALSEASAKYQQIQSIMRDGVFDGSVADALQNPVIVRLRQQYLDAQRQLTEWTAKFGRDHSAVVTTRQQIKSIQANLQEELAQISDTYKSNYQVAQSNVQALELKLAQLSKDAGSTNQDLVMLRALQSSAETYKEMYEDFLKRYTQTVQDQSFPIAEARVIEAALPPLGKSWPRGSIVIAAAAAVGLMVGFGIAFARDATDQAIRTPREVRAMLGLQFLGFLPNVTRRERRRAQFRVQAESQLAVARPISTRNTVLRRSTEDPFSPFAEVMRNVCLRLVRRNAGGKGATVVGCFSALPNEGKTTVSANLAQYMAASGKRTLLIDWDLRKLSLTQALAPAQSAGFAGLVDDGGLLADAIWQDPVTGLHFLPGGKTRPLSELLQTSRARLLLQEIRAEYDYVVVDLPALVGTSDAVAASDFVDGLLLVVEWAETSLETIAEELSRTHVVPAQVIGVILNKVNFQVLKRYAYAKSSYHYGYRPAAV